MTHPFDARPIVVAIAGPNGAGKSTFYEAHVREIGLPFVNADVLARSLRVDAYVAADMADAIRRDLARGGESFVFETVFSDPAGEKVAFLESMRDRGYTVVLLFIGLASADVSDERVAMRVLQGGHDVAPEKIQQRYARSLRNLALAVQRLPFVLVYDNSDLARPYRRVATYEDGRLTEVSDDPPSWLP